MADAHSKLEYGFIKSSHIDFKPFCTFLVNRSSYWSFSMWCIVYQYCLWWVELQLCVWSIDGWEKKKMRFIQAPPSRQSPLVGETRVQFHNDQAHLLVVHESQIAIYDSKLECSRSVSFPSYIFYHQSIFFLMNKTQSEVGSLVKWEKKARQE